MTPAMRIDIGGMEAEVADWSPGRMRLICPQPPSREQLDIRVAGRHIEGLRGSECAQRIDGRVDLESAASDARGAPRAGPR